MQGFPRRPSRFSPGLGVRQSLWVLVHPQGAKTVFSQMAHVTTMATGQVEHLTARRDQVGPALHPGAGRINAWRMGLG